MKPPAIVAILIVVCATLGLAGCGTTYRYELTPSVDTPDGVKTGFNVVEVNYRDGGSTRITGEALFLDLGPGKRPLIALLTKTMPPRRPDTAWRRGEGWEENQPSSILTRVYGQKLPQMDIVDAASRFKNYRGPRAIETFDLPDLVTFGDIDDPKSVRLVDRDNIAAALGDGVSWRSMTLEITNEPLTTGIETKLAWLPNQRGSLVFTGQRDLVHPERNLNSYSFILGN